MKLKILFLLLIITLTNIHCKEENQILPDNNIRVEEFVEDNSIFPNPERGMYIHKQFDNSDAQALSSVSLNAQRQLLGYSLVLTIYYLGEFIDGPINDKMLNLIEQNMKTLRENGYKAILRFAYSQSELAPIFDATEDVTLAHIAQLAPVLQKNVDVIAVFQAGFIGAWGEWYFSTHYGNASAPDYAKRKVIVDALLDVMPEDRMISMRTPLIKTKMLNISFQDSLIRSEAHNATKKARLAHHNDCFLADATDMGTYNSTLSRNYAATDSKYTCMGGETCAPSSYAECQKAINEMTKYHWSYLNKDYHLAVLSDWKQKGCFDEIQKRLGYRFVLTKAEHPAVYNQANLYNVKITFDNIGFAAPYHRYVLKFLFRNNDGQIVYEHVSKEDARFWFGGESISLEEEIELPSLSKGDYDVCLQLTDANETLNGNEKYSIRFANENIWDEETGYNFLFKQTIE